MKRILILLISLTSILILISSCKKPSKQTFETDDQCYIQYIKEIDNCEYIIIEMNGAHGGSTYSITHKGNCKYCLERTKNASK